MGFFSSNKVAAAAAPSPELADLIESSIKRAMEDRFSELSSNLISLKAEINQLASSSAPPGAPSGPSNASLMDAIVKLQKSVDAGKVVPLTQENLARHSPLKLHWDADSFHTAGEGDAESEDDSPRADENASDSDVRPPTPPPTRCCPRWS
jgi:hypothetical protein